MSEILSQLWTPELQMAMTVFVVMLVILYVLSVVWVVRDAYLRGTMWYVWAIVALVPVVGIIAYCLLRPPLLQIDRDEQELEVALKQRQLMQYGECGNCGYPVEADYILCPNCHQRLKNQCVKCGHALDPSWTVCPYCATSLPAAPARRGARLPATRISRRHLRQIRPAKPLCKAPRVSRSDNGSWLQKPPRRAAFLVAHYALHDASIPSRRTMRVDRPLAAASPFLRPAVECTVLIMRIRILRGDNP